MNDSLFGYPHQIYNYKISLQTKLLVLHWKSKLNGSNNRIRGVNISINTLLQKTLPWINIQDSCIIYKTLSTLFIAIEN